MAATGATERVVGPALEDDTLRRQTLKDMLAFPEFVQRFARLADMRQYPGGGGDRGGKQEDDVGLNGVKREVDVDAAGRALSIPPSPHAKS
jgi:hypothetical protein